MSARRLKSWAAKTSRRNDTGRDGGGYDSAVAKVGHLGELHVCSLIGGQAFDYSPDKR
jgi:hypothetical protein